VAVRQDSNAKRLRVVIIGAGMAGVLAGIKLKTRGDDDFVIYEKGETVGGTWRENRYPGLACDTPAHSYSYSFALNPDWSAFYAPGPEIQQYFERATDQYGIRDHVKFGAEVVECRYRDDHRWEIETKDGSVDVADVLIAATGVLHYPKIPDIPGLRAFAGKHFHSARWDTSVVPEQSRIGVIGNGSTGIQLVSALAGRAKSVVHFQRTAQWIMPCPDVKYTEEEKRTFREDPAKIEEVRSGPEATARRARFTSAIIDVDSPELAEIQSIVERNLEESVRDPALREKLRPNYRAACKRLVFSAHYYEAVQRPLVFVEASGIACVEPNGVRMNDGAFHELDVLVLATGFEVDRFVRPIRVTGQHGLALDTAWAVHPVAYYAVATPEFPNLFLLNGPTGPVGNFSLIDIAEKQWAYIDQLIDLLRQGQAVAVAATRSALERYEASRVEAARRTVFASGCKSWYLDAAGVPQVWPWSYRHFLDVMARPQLEDYDLMLS
jgi:cation diffusion facilitator CzcD-associated flavoprotein CzcO